MLEAGDRVPDARVWATLGEEARSLRRDVLGQGLSLLCVYVFDRSLASN